LACGTPVVETNNGGMVDFINEKVGALVDVEDETALEREITRILYGDKKFDRSILANYAKENYSQEVVIQQLINLYKEII
jgi:glycosyltransferase involved in cell wall biosynthesis